MIPFVWGRNERKPRRRVLSPANARGATVSRAMRGRGHGDGVGQHGVACVLQHDLPDRVTVAGLRGPDHGAHAPSFSPATPARISTTQKMRATPAGSPSIAMPHIRPPAAPMPVQMA